MTFADLSFAETQGSQHSPVGDVVNHEVCRILHDSWTWDSRIRVIGPVTRTYTREHYKGSLTHSLLRHSSHKHMHGRCPLTHGRRWYHLTRSLARNLSAGPNRDSWREKCWFISTSQSSHSVKQVSRIPDVTAVSYTHLTLPTNREV